MRVLSQKELIKIRIAVAIWISISIRYIGWIQPLFQFPKIRKPITIRVM